MARLAPDGGKDAALTWYTDADDYRATIGQPTTYGEVASMAAHAALPPTFQAIGDYGSGRQRQVDAKTATATASGTIDHGALRKTADTSLRYVTQATAPVAVLSGQTINLAAWQVRQAD